MTIPCSAPSIVANNIYDSPAGRYRAFADGFFVYLEPLSAGNHDVHLKVSVLNPIKTNYNYNAALRKSVNAGDTFGSTVNYSHSTGDSIAPTIAVSPNNF